MITVLIQAGLSLLAGLALWKMWRAIDPDDRWARYIVLVGFAARAFAGTILFWISWLSLPILSRVQMGNGHWFFATDGKWYLREAIRLAEGGLPMIVGHHRTGASVGYVQTLATFTMLLGNAASVAVMVNLLSYLGMCLIILRWLKAIPSARIPALIALAAISLSPSAILWATQPLKDTLFQFLIVCMIAAGAAWQRAWLGAPAPRAVVGSALVMTAALFMASGIRWYFGFVVLVASGAFFLLTAVMSRYHWRALVAGAVTFFLLSQSLVISASGYLPPYLQKILVPWKASTAANAPLSTERIAEDLKRVRQGFENSGGATTIGVGGTLARIDSGREVVPVVVPVTEQDFAELARKKRQEASQEVKGAVAVPATSSKEEGTLPGAVDGNEPSIRPSRKGEAAAAPEAIRGATPVPAVLEPQIAPNAAAHSRQMEAGQKQPVETGAREKQPVETGAREKQPPVKKPDGRKASELVPQPSVAAEATSTVAVEPQPSRTVAPAAGPTRETAVNGNAESKDRRAIRRTQSSNPSQKDSAPAVTTIRPPTVVIGEKTTPAPAPATTAALQDESEEGTGGMGTGVLIMPTSTPGRLLAGTVAVLLPSGVSREMGLLQMGGGRGFWWFTDLDSIVFDLMVIIAIVFMVRRGQRATLRNPILWFVLLLVAVVVPIAYIITNYGTLFRLRAMLFVTIALIPLAISNRSAPEPTDAVAETEPPAESV